MIEYLNPFSRFPEPPQYFLQWEDWNDEYTITAAASPWIGTALSSGTGVLSVDEQYGVLRLSGNATSDNSGYQVQRDMETCALLTGKKTRFLTRFKLSDATESHFFAGHSITDTTICDGADAIAGLTPSDCIGFYKADGGATLALVVKRDSVVVCNTSFATLASDTYYWAAFEVGMTDTDGTGTARAWVYNGTTGALLFSSGGITSSVMPYSGEEILTESLALVSGTASGTITATIDCIGTLIER